MERGGPMSFLESTPGGLRMTADQVRSLQPALAALLGKFRDCFQKEPTFAHGERYLRGLLLDLKRKSVEPIALAAGWPCAPCRSCSPRPSLAGRWRNGLNGLSRKRGSAISRFAPTPA